MFILIKIIKQIFTFIDYRGKESTPTEIGSFSYGFFSILRTPPRENLDVTWIRRQKNATATRKFVDESDKKKKSLSLQVYFRHYSSSVEKRLRAQIRYSATCGDNENPGTSGRIANTKKCETGRIEYVIIIPGSALQMYTV